MLVEHVAVIGTLVLLESLLSADNAIVLAVQIKPLPRHQRKAALIYGMVGAFVLRGLGILYAQSLVHLWWVCAIGAAYLLSLSIRKVLPQYGKAIGIPFPRLRLARVTGDCRPKTKAPAKPRGFWPTVLMVEITDFFFAIDSLLVAVALSRNPIVLYIGAGLGIVLLRLTATAFIRLLERYPSLENLAYALVAWAAVKLGALAVERFWLSEHRYTQSTVPNLMPEFVYWPVLGAIVGIGVFMTIVHDRRKTEEAMAFEKASDAGAIVPEGASTG